MKLDARQVERFLQNPGEARAVLLYGPDTSLVADRGRGLARKLLGSLDDPFRFAELAGDQGNRILEEATAQAFGGGRRVVLVREAGDMMARAVEESLALQGDSLLILMAGDLPARSKLRALAEKHGKAAAIACYPPEGAKRVTDLESSLRQDGISIDRDALAWCAARIAPETGALRQAAELLRLYAGPNGRLSLDDAMAALGDQGSASVQDAIDAALVGDTATADRALTLAIEEGATPVGIIRILLGDLSRLRLLSFATAAGTPARDAIAALRPPIFFRRAPLITRAATMWREATIIAAITAALQAERACKQTAAPAETICRQLILNLAENNKESPLVLSFKKEPLS
jgi:DNA polymerase-3 subunit delta